MIKRLLIFLLIDIAILVGAASAQDVSVRYQSQAISSRGLPLANQNVAVCTQPANTNTQPCSPLATLATSTTTSSGGLNPTTTDANGNYFFYAAPGKYTIQIYGPQVSGQFIQVDVSINSGPATVTSLNRILFADQFAGADCGAKINAADAALGAVPGEIWLNQNCGLTISTAVNINGHVLRFIQGGTWTVSATISLLNPNNIPPAILGPSASMGTGPGGENQSVILNEANSANLNAMMQCGNGTTNGNNCIVRGILMDGNQANNSTENYGLLVNKSSRFDISEDTIRNFKSHSVAILSTIAGGLDESCCGRIQRLMAASSSGSSLFVQSTSDLWVHQSELVNAGRYGVECQSCGGLSIVQDEVSGNTLGGASLTNDGTNGSSNVTVVANHIANNNGHDIQITGSSTVGFNNVIVANNSFPGSTTRTSNTYDAINIVGSGFNVISGNFVVASSGSHTYRYGINISAGGSGGDNWNEVIGNMLDNAIAFGTGFFTGTALSVFNGNIEGGLGATQFSLPYIPNNTPLKWKDGSGNLQPILNVTSGNAVALSGQPTLQQVYIQPNPGITTALFTSTLEQLGTGIALQFQGSSSGSCSQTPNSTASSLSSGCNLIAAATACTNGELALSAGWQSTGAATVTAVVGNGQTCSWTITTGTTTAANPTVTDTLTNTLPAATTVCEMNIHGGTHTAAAGEGFQQTTLSATAPIFTFNGTPTAGGTTYLITRRCGP